MTTAAEWVSGLMTDHNITATDLARKADLAPSTVLRGVNAKGSQLGKPTLAKIGKALGVAVPNDIKDEAPDDDVMPSKDVLSAEVTLPEGRVKIMVPNNLSSSSRRKVELMVAALIEPQI